MADLYKYLIWCNVEQTYIEKWSIEEPTLCPNNIEHQIDSTRTHIIDESLDEGPKDRSGKPRVQQTSRKLGTGTYWTGQGDDPSDVTSKGGGTRLNVYHKIGDTSPLNIYADFNIIENETWIHEGYVTWKNCEFDTISFEMVPVVTQIEASTNTYYNLYGGYLIVPAAGDGTIDIVSDITDPFGGLVQVVPNDLGEIAPGYWNADWNSSTKLFENITAAPSANGDFNMFSIEITFARFVNRIPLLGDGFMMMQSSDSDQIAHGMRFKLIAETYDDKGIDDHDWQAACILTLHRENT
jgi:hypothetical protein